MKITKLEISQVRYLILHKKIKTISYVQRKLNISYNKARTIVESIKKGSLMLDYKDFFEKIEKFKEIQEQQKQRGLNDFNLLTTVRKYHDEVYLHSAMIGALLNPHGLHYQKTLFLELFLKEIGLNEWGLDLDNVSVHVEYKDIDLYITDGIKHIIIENKIWADDQDCQIIKYINIIYQENQEALKKSEEKISEKKTRINDEFLRVIYLTAQAKKIPDEHKVIKVTDDKQYIYFDENKLDKLEEECSEKDHTKALVPNGLKNYEVRYQKNDYKDILRWLEKSKKQVSNITNLNEAIWQYMDVVEMVNNNYEGKVMNLKEYISDKDNDLDFYLLKNIVDEYNNMIKKSENDFINKMKEKIKNKYTEENKLFTLKIISSNIFIKAGIENEKIIITIFEKDWKKIEPYNNKKDIFEQIKGVKIFGEEFDMRDEWDNVYASIEICDKESKKFLEVDQNVTVIVETIEEVIKRLKV